MIFGVCSGCIMPVEADDNTITICTKEDYIRFAEECTLDSSSKGKTVNLTDDIDFSDGGFVPVPIFCGVFNGNGHTLSGITYKEKGSYKGIFRYVEQGGKISDLNVSASFELNGSKSFLGGIAGENSGIIEGCSFDGNLKGENVIGGIAGNNTEYGQIISCNSSGVVVGENSTGGIVGKNRGFIQGCTNNASVNTTYEEKKSDITDIETDTDAIIESYKNSEEEKSEESILGHTDTGGIVGFTTGIIQGCINNGAVGYRHIGYNVGGIAGRQSGYILGCKNYGFIQGRKDVGGIVGQAEPYILLHTSDINLQNLRNELDSLNSMVNKFIADTEGLSDDAREHLDSISEYAKSARVSTESLIEQGTDFVDDNIAEINAQAAILSNTLDRLEPVFDTLGNGGDDFGDAVRVLSETINELDLYAPNLENEIKEISSALSHIADSGSYLSNFAVKLKKAVGDLKDAVSFNDLSKVRRAVSDMSAAVDEIIKAKQEIRGAIETIESILNSKPESFEAVGANTSVILENPNGIKESNEVISESLKIVINSLDIIILNGEINFSDFRSAANSIRSAMDNLSVGIQYVTGGIDDLGVALTDFYEKLDEYTEDIGDELSEAKENTIDSIDSLSYAIEDIGDAVDEIGGIIADLADEDSTEFVKFGDGFRESSEELFDSLSGISGEIGGIKELTDNEGDRINSDLSSVSNQFNVVLNLLISEVEEIKNGAESLADIFVDVSDEDISSARQGKIEGCTNSAKVEADRNTGGIVGNMAIEYSKDPEDETEKPNTLNFTYRTKAILQGCVNDGGITGKKDCVGGIVGNTEIGTVYECENYGDAESTGGNYVGGVAGKSDSSVRKCYAKGRLDGKRYVGGISGKAGVISSSFSIVTVMGDENNGAICGDGDRGNLYNNYYVNKGIGAVDGISYKDKGEEISFDTLKEISGIPSRFISFTVTFIADDKVVEVQNVKYGEEAKRIKYPTIPQKDGGFGKWHKPEVETVTEDITIKCDYKPYITMISSEEKNENGKLSVALAEGEFTDSAILHITAGDEEPPINNADNVKVYDISFKNAELKDEDTVTVRILNENKDKVTVWRLENGKWEQIKASKKGKYTVMQIMGQNSTVCLKYDKRNMSFVWIIAMLAAVGGTAAAVVVIKRKKGRAAELD